jgi:hypothetical protein
VNESTRFGVSPGVLAAAQHDRRDQEGDSRRQQDNIHQQEHGRQSSPQPDRHDAHGPEQRHEYRRDAGKRSKGGPSINPTAGMSLDICARLEGTNPNHAMCGKTFGNAGVHEIGNVSIVPGTNVVATTDTASRKIASAPISAVDTGFASTTSRS